MKNGRERKRERGEDAGSFRFTIQFAAPRNLIKRFYVYYGQFYMCVYPRHIRFARHRPTSRPSIIHKFHPLLGFLAFPSSKSRPLSNEPRKKEKKKISNLSKEETTVFLFFFYFLRASTRFGHPRVLPRRFYEGATHSRAGCLRSAALRPVYTNGIYMHTHRCIFSRIFDTARLFDTPCPPPPRWKYRCIHRVELLTTPARNNRATHPVDGFHAKSSERDVR